MIEILKYLVSFGLFGFVGYYLWLKVKIKVTEMICAHPELSDEKVKYITRMISKNEH